MVPNLRVLGQTTLYGAEGPSSACAQCYGRKRDVAGPGLPMLLP